MIIPGTESFFLPGNCAGGAIVKKILLATLLAGAVCSPLAYDGGYSHVEAAEAVHAGAYQAAEADNLLLVNKTNKLPDDYEEKVDLVTVKNCFGKDFQVERETYKHFLSLREDLLQRGIQIELESAYRSVARQRELIEELRATEGEDYVKKYAAVPGYSEHHTGLALDVTIVKDGSPTNDVYGTWETPYQKMHRRLAEHGFILRYPPGKSAITGYDYESWHCRYVGREAARKIFLQGLTLEEYLSGGRETQNMQGKYGSAEYWAKRNPAGEKELLGAELKQLQEEMRRQNSLLVDMESFPTEVTAEYIRGKIKVSRDNYLWFEPENIYENGSPLTKERYRQVEENCVPESLPARQAVKFALTTCRANLRYLPESEGWYEGPRDTHYDLVQALTLYPAEPLAVLAESRDKKYFFVQLRNYVGWVDKKEIVLVDHARWLEYAAPKDFLVFADDKKRIHMGEGSSLLFQMGARLPLKKPEVQRDGTWLAVMPVSVEGKFEEKLVSIPADETVHKGWLPYSENNVLRQSFRFLGELYGWCGLEEGVDCSLFTADVYRSFGLDIPGDAVEQRTAMLMRKGIEDLSREGKLTAIGSCHPGDLLFSEGHVMLYLGKDDRGEPHIIHASSSRWFPGEGDEGALKYYTRRVTVDDLWWHKTDNGRCIDGLIAIGGIR